MRGVECRTHSRSATLFYYDCPPSRLCGSTIFSLSTHHFLLSTSSSTTSQPLTQLHPIVYTSRHEERRTVSRRRTGLPAMWRTLCLWNRRRRSTLLVLRPPRRHARQAGHRLPVSQLPARSD